jgi:alpha-mannan endo-1,2-alpha-mannanase / glycoprotein endo-alpha-1,2-mannosidase
MKRRSVAFAAVFLLLISSAFLSISSLSQNKDAEKRATKALPRARPSKMSARRAPAADDADAGAAAATGQDEPSPRVVTFYYPWYGNPEFNGEYLHWNHEVLVDGGARFVPPLSIGANFFPEAGTYSSLDPAIVLQHFRDIRRAGVGNVCISWWGQHNSDGQLSHLKGYTDNVTALLLDTAARVGISVSFHHEPYEGRTAASTREDIQYVIDTYGDHPALHREDGKPMFFVYDAYMTKAREWASILSRSGADTIRGTKYDACMISLYVNDNDKKLVVDAGFDGFYTYFAADGFTPGSTSANWLRLARWAESVGVKFIPSVGPGYDDTRIRPWNAKNRRGRESGKYYDRHWESAISTRAGTISVTSWNEWHEGTQIEAAVPKVDTRVDPPFTYEDYSPLAPDHYVTRTRHWVSVFEDTRGGDGGAI